MSDLQALIEAIVANPDDDTVPLALADYLQEHGATSLAVFLRSAVQLRRDPTVYLISEGEYSDYSVYGVYTSEEAARKVIGPGSADVETRKLNQCLTEVELGLRLFEVTMDEDGNNARAAEDHRRYTLRDCTLITPFTGLRKPVKRPLRRFNGDVWARDEQHAIKIANDRRIAMLAEEASVGRTGA